MLLLRLTRISGAEMTTEANQDWAEVLKSNKTSIEDKLDMILAQNQEMQVDTERVASLVPLVTGNEAMEQSESMDDASEEINQDNPEDMVQDEEDPFSFLDGDEDIEGDVEQESEAESPEEGVMDGSEEPFDDAEGDDVLDEEESPEAEESAEGEESDDVTFPDTESEDDVSFPDTESDDVEEDEDVSQPEETSEPTETSDDVDDEEGEDEEKKPSVGKSYQPVRKTRTVRPIQKSNVVSKVSRPPYDFTYGRASGAGFIAKTLGMMPNDDEFEIGYGVDPHKAVEKDWEYYRALLKIKNGGY